MLVMKASKLEEVGPIQPEATGQAGNSAFPGSEAVGVDKIRDLLFGNQMQDYDRRFSMLEERFLQRFREIESEAARNLSLRIECEEADGVARSPASRRKRPAHRRRQGDRPDPARA
jgi:hypothetical protein